MKITQRILSALLIMVMVCALIPVGASAADPIEITTTDGKPEDIVGMPANADIHYLSIYADMTVDGAVDPGPGVVKLVDYRSMKENKTTATSSGNTYDIPSVRPNQVFFINAVPTNYYFTEGTKTSVKDKVIRLGYNGTEYGNGLGVYAGSRKSGYAYDNNYLTYAVPAGVTNFYAVAGVNGNNDTGTTYGPIRFEVWGGNSADGEFTQLAYAVVSTWHTAEFNVNITGYSYIKLVHKQDTTATGAGSGLECAWANAAVYSVGAPVDANVHFLSDAEPVDYRTLYQGSDVYNEAPVTVVRNDSVYYISTPSTYHFIGGTRKASYTDHGIYLGANAQYYAKGLGVFAGSKKYAVDDTIDNWLTYAVPTGAASFGAVVGVNGQNATNAKYGPIRFEVWGGNSVDGEFTMLDAAEVSTYETYEFDVNIAGYKYIKLVHKQAETATEAGGNLECVWANAAIYTVAEEPDTTPETNIRFGSALSLLTRWNKGAFTGVTGAQVTFKGEAVNATYTPDNTHYNVEYPGVAGKEMTEQVTVSLLNGQETVTTVTASVRDHALEYLATGSNAYYKTAMYHMLQFGAAAQNYFQYNTGAMANVGLADYESNAMTGEVSSEDVAERKVISGEAKCFYGTNLRLEDRINLMFYFEKLPAGATAKITVNGETVTKAVKALENGLYMVEMDELAVADYKETVICTIYDGEAEVISVQDSVAGYAFRAQTKGGKLAAVCAELLEYAEAVTRYLRSKHNYNITFTQPTCTEPAYKVYTCTDCGFSYQEVFDKVSAIGHQWDGTNCTVCGNIPLPQYSGVSDATYSNVFDYVQSYKYVYSDANPKAYENSLKVEGFKLIQENNIGSNRFVTYVKEGIMVHCSYFDADNEFRIVSGHIRYTGATEPVNDYEEVVTPSISMIEIGGTGLSMVIQLADGSFVIIDGGFGQNTSTAVQNTDMERLYKFLKDNTPNGGIPQITWMITHVDPDHIGLVTRFFNEYKHQIKVNTICFNPPSLGETNISNKAQLTETYLAFVAAMKDINYNNLYIIHTGSKLYLPGCEIEFLITAAEDLNPSAMTSGNHTSNAWRMTIEGKTILITGDIEEPLSNKMANNYGNYLASNILQVVHHGVNGATKKFNEYVASGTVAEGNNLEVCFWPIRSERIWRTEEYPTINQPLWNSQAVHYYHDYTTTLLLPDLTVKSS